MNNYRNFYTEKYASGEYGGATTEVKKHPFYPRLERFVTKYGINDKYYKSNSNNDSLSVKCLEIGSGKGLFQDVVNDYTGLDYSESVDKYYHKPFVSASATELPFDSDSFDYIWSRAVWEHIPDPEKALEEAMRVLKPKGVFLLAPAWHCRPWAANGYQVRPYSDFGMFGKLYKLIIPILDFLPYRIVKMLVKRVFWLVVFGFTPTERFRLPYKKLKPNYEVFWQSDSDACCGLDPFLTILWCKSKGYKVVSHKSFIKAFLSKNEAIEIQK